MKIQSVLAVFLTLGLAVTNLSAAPVEGDLIQAGGETIFIIRDGLRCQIQNMEAFEQSGFKVENIIKISDEDLAAISEGPMFTSPIRQPYKTAKEGDLIQGNHGVLHLIRDGLRCRIPNMEIFKENGFAEADIINISDEDLEAIPEGPVFTVVTKSPAPGASTSIKPYKTAKQFDIIQSPDGAIYVILDGKRCLVPSMEAFNENGLKAESIIKISDEDLKAIPAGPNVE